MWRIAYLRVSTDKQKDSGAGLAAQRRKILEEADRRGWERDSLFWLEDVITGKTAKRPSLERARTMLAAGVADTLIVDKMDRLSRSLLDFAQIMADAQKQGWALVAFDAPADPTTPAGEAMANMLATFSQFERRLIGERTKRALAEKRAQGVVLGRPRTLPETVRQRIKAERATNTPLQAIADRLNEEGVPTAQSGKCWHASTVRAVALA